MAGDRAERTTLSPAEEAAFHQWASQSGIGDLDRAPYDYRGFFKANGPVPYRWLTDHLPDTFKQHGHPTFSQESQYSRGASDGGLWLSEDQMLQQPPMAVSHTPDPIATLKAKLLSQMRNR